jgi:RNA polymerase sigma factor (sigma-70 family)
MAAAFPSTRLSVVAAARTADPDLKRRAFESLIAIYWRPVYKYLRVKHQLSNEDAQDLTQEFFVRAMEKDFFDRYDPGRARFRTFLRTCLDGFASNARKADRRIKRGGQVSFVPLDFASVEQEIAAHKTAAPADFDEYFHHEWIRSLFSVSVDRLRAHAHAQGKGVHFALFEIYDLESAGEPNRPTYQSLAERFGLSVTDVTNHLAWARRELRGLVLERLREICGSDEEYHAEALQLLGVDPR